MPVSLHPKIKELQRRVGSTPIIRSKMKVEQRSAVTEEGSDIIKAYHCVWGLPDDHGTVWHKGCFKKSITERGPASNAKQKILVLYMHNTCDPLCVPTILKEDDYGLYAEWTPDLDGSPNAQRTINQVRSGTINQFSFGSYYIWDKMKYDDEDDMIHIYESDLLEISPVTFGSQAETYAKRSAKDYGEKLSFLVEETDDFIKSLPRSKQLELRQLIDRHISLAKTEPDELRQESTRRNKPKGTGVIDYSYLNKHLKQF